MVGSAGVAVRETREVLNLEVGSAGVFGVAAEAPLRLLKTNFTVLGSVVGENGIGDRNMEENPFEILGGLRFRSSRDFLVTAGGGAGLTAGYGAPKYRVLLSMQYAPVTRRLRATASRSPESIVIEVPEPAPSLGTTQRPRAQR